jgi:hypothetical protein
MDFPHYRPPKGRSLVASHDTAERLLLTAIPSGADVTAESADIEGPPDDDRLPSVGGRNSRAPRVQAGSVAPVDRFSSQKRSLVTRFRAG